ncbi:hypothetical protein OVN18_00065 [Microcella daejeonensis]|uniref:Uncharacterized protein n=1 Tax=Microcella daejeonensis TaxID=2994971 RepID=A0A9E8MKW1_9MICO|nr:hypothetical protein [Microcella daejeonensis]WAB81449.1 hypothetical protein OVN18_13100 [Microcella daejeonensis]WAB81463.1 hypothetical protein OVN18_00065 [Microcella daejeonensis]
MNRRSTYVAPHPAWRWMLGAGIALTIVSAVLGGTLLVVGPFVAGVALLATALALVIAGAVLVRRLRGPAAV